MLFRYMFRYHGADEEYLTQGHKYGERNSPPDMDPDGIFLLDHTVGSVAVVPEDILRKYYEEDLLETGLTARLDPGPS